MTSMITLTAQVHHEEPTGQGDGGGGGGHGEGGRQGRGRRAWPGRVQDHDGNLGKTYIAYIGIRIYLSTHVMSSWLTFLN